jgi:hypothetical protein
MYALQNWVQSLLSLNSDTLNNWKDQLNDSLDDYEKSVLMKYMPILKSVFSTGPAWNKGNCTDWKLFLKLLHSFSLDYKECLPLVIWVDDFHWIEKTALQWVMNAIQSSVSAKGML